MIRRLLLCSLLVVLVPLGLVLYMARWVDQAGDLIGRQAAALCSGLAAYGAAPAAPAFEAPSTSAPSAVPEVTAVSFADVPRPVQVTKRGRKVAKPAAPVRGIFVSARSVLGLARSRTVPQAVPVAAAVDRPAGLQLVGVAGLGLGLRDGDVLTGVAGVPARSVPGVVALVIQARAARSAQIAGEFYRGGERWNLIVEQPYLDEPSRPASP